MDGHRSMMQDAHAVERVVQQRRAEQDLHHPPDRAGVERQQVVVGVRVAAGEVDVDDVQDDEQPRRRCR